MKTNARILIVEDDPDLSDLLNYNLRNSGFECKLIPDGLQAHAWLKNNTPDLILLDLMLPGMDGLELSRRLRQDKKDIPLIMLTAKSEEVDKVVGLELGADDYVTKPFNMRELILRVKAVLRRGRAEHELPPERSWGRLRIDEQAHQAWLDDKPLELTATEFALLLFLSSRPGRVQTREHLLEQVWGYANPGYARTVDTHMRRLRQKLEPIQDCLETMRGVGYRFNPDPARQT
ncbi:MAG: response regulator transcription factor [Desulfarculales bacterium]|nr:response regulator transcription factor [Desulfarculales bacterium]